MRQDQVLSWLLGSPRSRTGRAAQPFRPRLCFIDDRECGFVSKDFHVTSTRAAGFLDKSCTREHAVALLERM